MSGPYESERDTWDEPMVREATRLREQAPVAGYPYRAAREEMLRHLLGACQQCGVHLGAYDRQKLEWLCRWEPSTVQVVIGLVGRAYEAGRAGK